MRALTAVLMVLLLSALVGCAAPCTPQSGDCDRDPANGCETDLNTDAHCGACGVVCRAEEACNGVVCRPRVCPEGSAHCTSDPLASCETSLDSVTNCGACGRVCPVGPFAAAACVGRQCALVCDPDWVDVDGEASNGCEARISRDERNCGVVGAWCATSQTCLGGRCVTTSLRQIAPISGTRVTHSRPTLRWLPRHDHMPVRLEVCATPACAPPEFTLVLTGPTARPVAALSPGAHFWRLVPLEPAGEPPTPVWEFFVPARSAAQDTSFGSVPDLNGDGLADLVVFTPSATEASGMAVYLGAPGGPSSQPDPRFVAPTAVNGQPIPARLLRAAPDMNGDGVSDLVLVNVGNTVVILGGRDGLRRGVFWPHPPRGRDHSDAAIAVGDLNGDGYGDLVDSSVAPAFLPCRTPHAWFTARSGSLSTEVLLHFPVDGSGGNPDPLAPAGDLDGDGLADLVADNPFISFGLGSETLARWVSDRGLDGVNGPSLRSGAGDVNGDGYADVIGGPCDGDRACAVYLGGVNGQSASRTLPLAGVRCAALGDINHDGFDDLQCEGGAFLGRASGPLPRTPTPERWGGRAFRLGDTNGDGVDDVAVADGGTVTVWAGRADGPPRDMLLRVPGSAVVAGW